MDGNYINTVGDLIHVLQTVPPETKLAIYLPRSWVKRQPDETRCYIQSAEITPFFFNIKTLPGIR